MTYIRGLFSVGAMGARHPRFLRSNTGAPTSAPTIFSDLLKRGTHGLKILKRPLRWVRKMRVTEYFGLKPFFTQCLNKYQVFVS